MKSNLLVAFALLASSALPAQAAGPFDGLYKSPYTPTGYISLSQKDNHVIAAIFDYAPISRGSFVVGQVRPIQLNYWDLFGGDWNGSYVRIQGQTSLGTCVSTFDIWLDANNNLRMRPVSVTTSPDGQVQGLVCNQVNFVDTTAVRVQ